MLYIAADQKLLGMIAVADPVKKTSAEAIREMEQMGLDVVMLTGEDSGSGIESDPFVWSETLRGY